VTGSSPCWPASSAAPSSRPCTSFSWEKVGRGA
jgi:hypothetical protein